MKITTLYLLNFLTFVAIWILGCFLVENVLKIKSTSWIMFWGYCFGFFGMNIADYFFNR